MMVGVTRRIEAVLFDVFFFSSRRRHTRCSRDWSSDVCSSDLGFCIFLYGQKAHPMLFFSSIFANCAIHSSVFSPDSPIQIGTSWRSRKSMYCRITLSSGAVQYLWNVYATFESNGFPKIEKFVSHCAPPRKRMWWASTFRISPDNFL